MKEIEQNLLFQTVRISVRNWQSLEKFVTEKQSLAESVLKILTPNVTKSLPDDWQGIATIEEAQNWINERKEDSNFFAVQLSKTSEIVGFLFLYGEQDLRLGYLLAESFWGKGLASELIKGLVEWCKSEKNINSISGGVEKENIGSIKVLEKNGFLKSQEEMPENMIFYKREF